MTDLLIIAKAADFAARRHVDMRRKGRAAEPYVNHLAEVALLLAEATSGRDGALVAAGWLHDTVEDTRTSLEELAEVFGKASRRWLPKSPTTNRCRRPSGSSSRSTRRRTSLRRQRR